MKNIPFHGKASGTFFIIDDEDYDLVSQFRWHLSRKGYAQAMVPARLHDKYPVYEIQVQRLLMHDVVDKKSVVDHINRNKLDNRRSNLRICSIQKSNMNRAKINFKRKQSITSKYKGVWLDRNKWRTAITVNGKRIYLGRYNKEEDAAIAYNKAAIKYCGEFACLNVVQKGV